MKTLIINNKIIQVYDSIDDMPIVNFQKYNKYLLIDSGVGSDADDIDAHITKVAKYVSSGDKKNALLELQNMRQNMYMVNCEISPKYLAFAALIHSVDGKINTDLSDDGLKRLLESIREIKHLTIIKFLTWLKKKVTSELEQYFPETFSSSKEKDAYDNLKRRTLLKLDSMINGNDNASRISEIDTVLFSMYKPGIFAGSDSIEIKYDKQYENACLIISQKTNLNAKDMTVLQFYNALDTIKQQMEAETKSLKRNKKSR